MSSNFGKLCREGIFGSLKIKDKTVLDSDANLTVTSIKNKGPLKTDYIAEKTPGHGIAVQHNLCIDSDAQLQTDCINDKTGNGVTVKADVCVDSGYVLKVQGTPVVGQQQPPIGNANAGSGIGQVADTVNDILTALRTHGLIAQII